MPKKMSQQDAKNWFKSTMPIVFEKFKDSPAWRNCNKNDTESAHFKDPLAYFNSVQSLKYPAVILPHWLIPILNDEIANKAKNIDIWQAVAAADFESLLFFVRIAQVNLRPDHSLKLSEDEEEHTDKDIRYLLHALLEEEYPTTVECLKLLIGHHAEVNMPDEMNLTPLHQILLKPQVNVELVEILLENKAKVNNISNNNHTLFDAAQKNDRPDIIKLLLDHTVRLPTDGSALLCWAAAGGKAPIVEYISVCKTLLDYFEVSINAKNELAHTALMTAITHKKDEMAAFLLDYKPNNHLANKNEGSMLLSLLAVRCGQDPDPLPLAKILLNKGADPHAKSDQQSTPLDIATIHGNQKLVELFNQYNCRQTATTSPSLKSSPIKDKETRTLARTISSGLLNPRDRLSTTPLQTPPHSPACSPIITWRWPEAPEPLHPPKLSLYDTSSSDSYESEAYDSSSSQRSESGRKSNSVGSIRSSKSKLT